LAKEINEMVKKKNECGKGKQFYGI
jgi:hypothetical protein